MLYTMNLLTFVMICNDNVMILIMNYDNAINIQNNRTNEKIFVYCNISCNKLSFIEERILTEWLFLESS